MRLKKLSVLMALVAGAALAHADITITPGPGSVTGDENVQFNQGTLVGTGNPVQGITNQSGFVVNFTGTEDLTTPAAGQARIEAVDGAFNSLQIGLDQTGGTYTSLIVNLNAAQDGQVTFTIDQAVGSPFIATFDIDRAGENFFIIQAINGELITNSSFTTTSDLQDVRQIRIGGAVPEPASCATLVVGVAALLRRRKARKQ